MVGVSTESQHVLTAYAEAKDTGTSYAQFQTAKVVAALADDLVHDPADRALLSDARAALASSDAKFGDAERLAQASADAWQDAGDHAEELAMRIVSLKARIDQRDHDVLEILPLADRLEHLTTALRATNPHPRRLVGASLTSGFARLAAAHLDAADEHFADAAKYAVDDVDRAAATGAKALCAAHRGDSDRARKLAEASLALARSSRDDMQIAMMLRFLIGLHSEPEQLSLALTYAEEATSLAGDLGDVFAASCLRLQGLLRVAAGQVREGCLDLERALNLMRTTAYDDTISQEVSGLLQTLVGCGRHDDAARVAREHADVLDALEGDERAEIDIVRYTMAVRDDDFASAARFAQSAADLMGAAHHKDAAAIYDAAADAWTLAGDVDRSAAARQRAHDLGT